MPTQYYKSPGTRPRSVEARSAQRERELARIRRKYRKGTTLDKKLLPGERKAVEDTVIVLRLAGYDRSQICRIIGISSAQVKSVLDDPKTTERLVHLRGTISQAALDLLQGYMIEAIQTIVDIMRMADDDKIVLQACAEILDRAGIVKASRQERLQVNETKTTLTDDGIVEALRAASPEVQEQAAQLFEQLEGLLSDNGATPPVKKKRQPVE